MPLSIFLEKFSKNIQNIDKKILILVIITTFVFVGRNVDRLTKEYNRYGYMKNFDLAYPINSPAFKIQDKFNVLINNQIFCDQNLSECNKKMYSVKIIYGKRYLISKN